MVAPALLAAARVVAPKVVQKVLPKVATKTATVRTAVSPVVQKYAPQVAMSAKKAQTALKGYTSPTSKGTSIAAGASLASKVVPKSLTGKIVAGAVVAPVAKDLYGKIGGGEKSGQSLATTGRADLYGGYSEVGGVESGAMGVMPTIGSAARVGALPQIQSLIADPRVKGALVAGGLLAAGAEALGIIDVIPGVGRPKAKKKTTAKRKKTTAKTATARRKATAKKYSFKELAKRWKKLSPAQKAKYEGMFSEYIKVHREKGIAAKTTKRRRKTSPVKRRKTTKTTKRRMPKKVKAQQGKMKAAAKKWRSYKGPMSYREFMSRELKR